jgi:hypothetical protein
MLKLCPSQGHAALSRGIARIQVVCDQEALAMNGDSQTGALANSQPGWQAGLEICQFLLPN